MSVTTRLARPEDWPMIQRFHREMNEAQGTNTALPTIFGPSGDFAGNIPIALIIERDGHPVSSFYFENVPECCFAGCDPQATAVARREIDRIAFCLRNMGYTGIKCDVPQRMGEAIESPLLKAGFRETTELRHFFKDLRLPSVAEGE